MLCYMVGRDDWIDLFAMLTMSLRRRSGFALIGILPSASFPNRTALFARFATDARFLSMSSASLKQKTAINGGFLVLMVGMTGFEPATTCTPCKCATRLRYIPNNFNVH